MRRFMGRMETGVDTISDPAMAAGQPGWALDYARARGLLAGPLTAAHLAALAHPDLPARFQAPEKRLDGTDADALFEIPVRA